MPAHDRPVEAVVPAHLAASAAAFRYAPGMRVDAGDLLFVSGQVGRDEALGVVADPEAQFEKAFENIEAVVRAAGATLADVVEITTYLASMEHPPLLARVKDRFFTSEPYHAWTGVAVRELAQPGLLLEVKATAAL